MKNASILLSVVASLAASTSWALDCDSLANSPGVEPAGYAQLCRGVFYDAPWINPAAKLLGQTPAFAGQLTAVGESVPIGLYSFTVDDFPGAVRVGEAEGTANVHGLDFNPALTRLYGAQFLPGIGSRLGVLDGETGAFRQPISILGIGLDQVTGLTIDPVNGVGWLSTVDILTNNPQLTEARLWRFFLPSATAEFVAPQLVGRLLGDAADPVFVDIAMNCDGELYGHNISDDSIYRIDTEDAEATLVGSHGLPANFAQGMDFDNTDGSLYAWIYTGNGSNSFGTIDLATGAFSPLATDSPRGQWEGAVRANCSGLLSLDQPGLTGAWYAPYTSGQGFTLRYFADSRTLFMPWFTFTREDEQGEEPGAEVLRWYTLQGQIADDATEAVLPIYQVTDGAFDELPGTLPLQVGEARIRFFSCTEGVLEYQFLPEHNGGVGGATSLTRLLPLVNDCIEADGSTTESDTDYDGAVTGHWFDPATAGQGLEIFRVEQTDDEDGFLFATWFTFDPSSAQNIGPDSQHWFTLQGQNVDEDEENIIQTGIYESRGGSFDEEPASLPIALGTAEIEMVSCSQLTLRYDFSDIEAAGDFRNLDGEITLQRIGACP